MLIFCDFDGTISDPDITNTIWDHYIRKDWRDVLLPPYRDGKITMLDVMSAGYAEISAPAEELIAFAKARAKLRDGFERFAEFCRRNGHPLWVVSSGLDWYLKSFLPPGIPFTCYSATLDGCWKVAMPADILLTPGEDFKVHVVEKIRQKFPPQPIVYIGDGRNDFPPAKLAERVFAVKDSSLARLAAKAQLKAVQFESFDEVINALH